MQQFLTVYVGAMLGGPFLQALSPQSESKAANSDLTGFPRCGRKVLQASIPLKPMGLRAFGLGRG